LRRIPALSIVVVLTLVATGAFAEPPAALGAAAPPMRLEPRPCTLLALRFIQPQMVPALAKSLSLTDEQKTQVTDLLTKAEAALKPKIEEQRDIAKQFVVAMASSDVSQAALVSALEKAMKAEGSIAAEKIKTLFALRAILTDQQKTELNKIIEQRTESWRREGFAAGVPTPLAPPIAPPAPAEEPKPAK